MESASEHRRTDFEQVNISALTPTYLVTKRCFDIVASLIGLVFLSWFFLLLALVIKIDDPHGKVFYSQSRLVDTEYL